MKRSFVGTAPIGWPTWFSDPFKSAALRVPLYCTVFFLPPAGKNGVKMDYSVLRQVDQVLLWSKLMSASSRPGLPGINPALGR
jgi:hypothetical protein